MIENIGGGGGSIACQTTARAAPDGYTLMVGYVATHATSPAVRKVPYDAIKDFTPVAMVGGTRNMLVVHPSLPVSDLKGFVEYAKGKASKVTFGAGGIGTLNHLLIEQLKGAAGFDTVIAQYKGIGPVVRRHARRAARGDDAGRGGGAAAHPREEGQADRGHGPQRHALLPEVPTFEESGFKGFDGVQWYGIVGPAKMPAGSHAATECRDRQGARFAGAAAAAGGGSDRADADDPGRVRRLHPPELTRYTTLARERNIRLDD